MRMFIIRLLFNLIEGIKPKVLFKIEEEEINKWLDEIYSRQEFRDYVRKRDMELLQELGKGVDREKYILLLGQRVEINKLLYSSRIEFQKAELKAKNKKSLLKKKK